MVAVPADRPVTRPELLIVAMLGLPEIQDDVVPEPASCVVPPIQTESVPVTDGNEFTVTTAVTLQPLLLV